MLQYFGYGNVN